MAEFIVNPRRAPRATARCRAAVVAPSGAFDAETEDIGALGCQVVSPSLVKRGDRMALAIGCEGIPDPLRVTGTAAWVSAQPPWRVGVAFEDAFVPSAERWFEKLAALPQGRGSLRRVPARIPMEAMVYLGPPPRFLLDFTAEEAALLRAIASGVRLDELRAWLRDRWPAAQRALFSLLARQAVTLSRGQSAHPDAWKRVLSEVEASLAVESLGSAPPAPAPPARARPDPAASPWGTPALEPHPMDGEQGPPLDPAPAPPRGAARAEPGAGWTAPRPAEGGGTAGGRWRRAQDRAPGAQALYERALALLEAGDVSGAIALLREALSEAPGDPEIASALGRLALGGGSMRPR